MDRLRWSIYGYGAMVVGAAAMAGAAVLSSWQLAVASIAVFALGLVVLRLREVEPAARDDRFEEVTGSSAVTVIGVVGLIALWVLAVRNGGGPLIMAIVLTVLAAWRVVQRLRTAT